MSTGVLDRHMRCLCLIIQDWVQPQINLCPGQFLHPSQEAEQSLHGHRVFPRGLGGVHLGYRSPHVTPGGRDALPAWVSCGHKGHMATCGCKVQVWAGEWQAMILLPTPLLWKIVTDVPQCLPGPGISAKTPNRTGNNGGLWEVGTGAWCWGQSCPFVQLEMFNSVHPAFAKLKGKKKSATTIGGLS